MVGLLDDGPRKTIFLRFLRRGWRRTLRRREVASIVAATASQMPTAATPTLARNFDRVVVTSEIPILLRTILRAMHVTGALV